MLVAIGSTDLQQIYWIQVLAQSPKKSKFRAESVRVHVKDSRGAHLFRPSFHYVAGGGGATAGTIRVLFLGNFHHPPTIPG